jgi:hypothetical protein
MILDLALERDSQGNIINMPSAYQPEGDALIRNKDMRRWMQTVFMVRNQPYREFNDMSLSDVLNNSRMSWNQYVEPPQMDPAQSWKSRAFRPIVRNKIIAIAAHITAAVIYPTIYAQNKRDEEDKDAASVMRDIMEWVNERSEYEPTFIKAVISALIDPNAYVSTEYMEWYRAHRESADAEPKRVLDEELSGIKDFFVPCEEIWIPNINEMNIQKQPFVIHRRVIDYSDAEARYGDNENFKKYVRPGLQILLSDDELFYETYDKSLTGNLVEEIVAYNRGEDLRLVMVNGVLISEPNEPNPRKDKLVPYVPVRYELLSPRFFYGKSLAMKLSPDEELVNTAYRMVADGSFLQLMPPAVAMGVEDAGVSVMVPGMVTTFDNAQNPNASFQTLNTGNNLTAGYNLLSKVEASIGESSADQLQSGQPPEGADTAYEISRVEQNARVLLGLFGKMVAFAVRDWGKLKVGDIVQFLTVGDVSDLMSPGGMLKYRKFLIPEKKDSGKIKTKVVELDSSLPDEMTEADFMAESRKTQKREKDGQKLIRVNPSLFRDLKYMITIKAQPLVPDSPALEKAKKLEKYGLAIANPLLDQKVVTREWLLGADEADYADADKFFAQQTPGGMMSGMGAPGMGGVQAPQQLSQGFQQAVKSQEGIAPMRA